MYLFFSRFYPSDISSLYESHEDPDVKEHFPLVHGVESEPEVCEESEGEFQPRVEK